MNLIKTPHTNGFVYKTLDGTTVATYLKGKDVIVTRSGRLRNGYTRAALEEVLVSMGYRFNA